MNRIHTISCSKAERRKGVKPVRVIQAYRFALDPTPAQEQALRSHCGAQRFAYNWGLARITANLAQREAERSYGIPEHQLTPAASWSAWSLRKEFNQVKDQVAPWWRENSKEAYASGLANLANALGNWKAGRDGVRQGPKAGFPVFKGKRAAQSVRFSTGAFGLAEADRRHVRLPRIGLVRTHESTRTLARRIAADRAPARPGATVGVDVGVAHLAVLSTGQMVPNPRPLEHAQRRLRQLNRQAARRTGPDKHTGQQLIIADRWYPSSKTCSGCGAVKTKLALSERTYRCGSCGLVLDRDLNAARNLAALTGGASSPSRGATVNEPAGNPGKTRPAGTGYRHGKTTPLPRSGQRPRRKARTA
jgi:transposase